MFVAIILEGVFSKADGSGAVKLEVRNDKSQKSLQVGVGC